MHIALHDSGVDALHLNRRRDRRFLRMFAVDLNGAVELFETAGHSRESLFHFETDARMRGIDLVGFGGDSCRYEEERKKTGER
jgi:hypothetical protein